MKTFTFRELLVFIVDDDQMFLKTMEHNINRFFKGIKVKAFLSGEECLKSISMHPDVVFLDYMLNAESPGAMNGIKVLDRIKEEFPETPVVMMSGQDNMEFAVKIMRHGSYDYVVKSSNVFMRVRNIIQNIIYTFRLKREVKEYKKRMIALLTTIGITIAVLIYMQLFTSLKWF